MTKSVTQDKWDKAKALLKQIDENLQVHKKSELSFKELEKVRGFLCHLAMVYEIIFPYLKGFHLTLSSHLPKRDEEGWKMTDLEWIAHLESEVQKGIYTRN